jgi:LmbE family N-acetylglucosaminyl deacetylase
VISLRLDGVSSIVALGAHPDDIEIAAGGLLLRFAELRTRIRVHYVLLCGTPERQAEARAAASAFLPDTDVTLTFTMHDLPDGRLPGHWDQAKRFVHDVADSVSPDLVLAPRRDDAHQDHRLVGELAIQAFRDNLVLHYEIPKWDGDLGLSNLYVAVPDDLARRKVELLNAHYPSQKHHDWWDDEVFFGLMRLRGMECRARYAEAFSCSKGLLTVQ